MISGATYEVARRSFIRTLRQPAAAFPALIFPLMLLAVNSGGLDTAAELPGFPAESYLTFALAVPFIQGAIFALLNSGTDLAIDIETGFLDRLALSPIGGRGLLAGALGGVMALAVVQTFFYLAIGLAVGAGFEAGIAGVPVLLALSLAVSFGFGSIGAFLALRLGDSEAMQGMFPIMFIFLFFSSMALPRDLIEQDWFRTIATVNPVSYLIEGFRSFFTVGFDGEALALAFGFSLLIGAVFITAAANALRSRLVRT